MKEFKCPNCKNKKTKEDDVLEVMCLCGYFMKEVDTKPKNGKNK